MIPKPDFVTDLFTERAAQLLGHSIGDGSSGEAPRLSVPDDAGGATPNLEQQLWKLS
ncbi:MAG: hypothetical protein Phyf2KO_04340 [Phycisphaerales bacterium]